jgi:hypothetical protein
MKQSDSGGNYYDSTLALFVQLFGQPLAVSTTELTDCTHAGQRFPSLLLVTPGSILLQAATNETNQTVAEAERVKAEAEADRQALQEVRASAACCMLTDQLHRVLLCHTATLRHQSAQNPRAGARAAVHLLPESAIIMGTAHPPMLKQQAVAHMMPCFIGCTACDTAEHVICKLWEAVTNGHAACRSSAGWSSSGRRCCAASRSWLASTSRSPRCRCCVCSCDFALPRRNCIGSRVCKACDRNLCSACDCGSSPAVLLAASTALAPAVKMQACICHQVVNVLDTRPWQSIQHWKRTVESHMLHTSALQRVEVYCTSKDVCGSLPTQSELEKLRREEEAAQQAANNLVERWKRAKAEADDAAVSTPPISVPVPSQLMALLSFAIWRQLPQHLPLLSDS